MANLIKLQALYDHMLSDRKGHKQFNFGCFNAYDLDVPNILSNDPIFETCGTMGCMAGELPILFPNDWEFKACLGMTRPILSEKNGDAKTYYTGGINYIKSSFISIAHQLSEFFDITIDEVGHIFYPCKELEDKNCSNNLSRDSSLEDVLKNFKEYLDQKKSNQPLKN